MATILTYNQVIKLFNNFVNGHKFLNDFGNGQTSEIGTSRQMNFPYLWVTHRVPSTFNVTNRTLIPELNLTFILVDQINIQDNFENVNGDNSTNVQEVLSDTYQYAQDLVTYIITTMGQYGVKIADESVSLEPVYDETPDKAYGWVIDINLQITHHNCIIPIN